MSKAIPIKNGRRRGELQQSGKNRKVFEPRDPFGNEGFSFAVNQIDHRRRYIFFIFVLKIDLQEKSEKNLIRSVFFP